MLFFSFLLQFIVPASLHAALLFTADTLILKRRIGEAQHTNGSLWLL